MKKRSKKKFKRILRGWMIPDDKNDLLLEKLGVGDTRWTVQVWNFTQLREDDIKVRVTIEKI